MTPEPFTLHVPDEVLETCVGGAEQGCQVEPTELQAAEVLADVETRAGMRVELDWRAAWTRHIA